MHFKPAGQCLNVKKSPVKGESKRRADGKGKNQMIVNRVVTLERNTDNHILKPTPEWIGLKL
jgi:hypothetical protein